MKVLHVDDEPEFCDLVSFFLKREGDFEVDAVASSKEALDRLQSQQYEAIVVDYSLPDIDGIELLKILRAQGSQIPFIMFTGKGRDDTAVQALNNGADFYLEKGSSLQVHFAELANMIRQSVHARRAEEAVKDGERFMTGVFSGIQDGISVLDKDLSIVKVNPAMENWYSHKMPLVGKKCFDAYHGRDAYCEVCPTRQTLETGKVAHEVVPKTGPGGVVVGWLDLFSFPMRDSKTGQLSGVIEYVHDITERVRAEEALRKSLQERMELEAVVDKSHAVVVLWERSPGWPVKFVSKSIERFGYRREELVSGSLKYDKIIHPDDLHRVNSEIAEYLRKGLREFDQEYRIVTKSGETRWVADHTLVRESPADKPAIHEGVILDITERRLAEERLKEATSRLQAIVEAFPDLYFTLDSDGTIRDFNTSRVTDLYVSPQEFLGKKMQDVLPPHVGRQCRDALERVRQSAAVVAIEYPLEIEGQTRYFEARLVPMSGGQVFVAVRNMTERRRVDEALRSSEARYRQLADSITDVFFALDKDLKHTYWNKASEVLIGISAKDAIGKTLLETFPGTQGEMIARKYREILKTGASTSFLAEFEIGGKKRYFDMTAYPIETGISVIWEDVTERRQMEAAVLEANKRLRAIIEASPVGIGILDNDGKVTLWNPAAERMFGWSEKELLGKPNPLVPPNSSPLYEEMREREKRGEILPATELRHMRRDGSFVDISLSTSPLLDAEGKIMGTIGVLIDITDRKRYERALRQANKKLNPLESVTRHDAVNQLSVLFAWLDIAKEVAADHPVMEQLGRMQDSAMTLQRQLEFTADYQEMGVKEPEWLDLTEQVRKGIEGLDLKGVEVVDDLKGMRVFADPMLEKVFYNFVENSLRYGEKVTKVRFHAKESKDGLILYCEDDGVGIPQKDKEKIFERGFGKHTGFGLYMVREVLGITGIAVRETGEPRKGARFEMHIPAQNYRGKDQ